MSLDPQRIYDELQVLNDKIEGLAGKCADILLHQKEQNGKVDRNMECIAANTRLLEQHSRILSDHCVRLGVLETKSEQQSEFQRDAEGEFDWTRNQILDILTKVLPWIGVLGLVAERLLN